MRAELVGPLPTVTFRGGPRGADPFRRGAELPRVVYDVPRDTRDPRYLTCTDHHVACDCREAEHAEDLAEHIAEWKALRATARTALAGHQVERPWGGPERDRWRVGLCLCSGCVIERATHVLLDWRDVDHETGRVKAVEGSLAMGWAPGEVPF